MPSSVREGVRPRAARMRSYSGAVMLCWASNCGVMVIGSGTTAEDAVVITVASIVACYLRDEDPFSKDGQRKTCKEHTGEGDAVHGFFARPQARERWAGGGEWSNGCA